MSKKDLFYGDVEGRMEELKQKPITKEKETLFILLLIFMIVSYK